MPIRHESNLVLDSAKLIFEMRRRGLSGAAFAAEAGIQPGTLSGILHDKAVTMRVARRIAEALARIPVILDDLLVAS